MARITYQSYGGAEISTDDFDYAEMTRPEFERWREHMSYMRWAQEHSHHEDVIDMFWHDRRMNEYEFHYIAKYIPVNENWCGNELGNNVCVSCNRVTNKKMAHVNFYRVAVWGNDDLGMSIDFPLTDEGMAQALATYNKVQEFVTREELYELGFEIF